MFRYFGYMIEFFTGILLSCFGLKKKRRRIKNINNNNNNNNNKREIGRLWGIRHVEVVPFVVGELGVVSAKGWMHGLRS